MARPWHKCDKSMEGLQSGRAPHPTCAVTELSCSGRAVATGLPSNQTASVESVHLRRHTWFVFVG
jgi:hypothetical protein